jgi:apolipoprotein N-acyltransferase
VLLSATALWHGTGLDPAWGLTWVAPVPALAFALSAPAWAAAAAAFTAWGGGGLNLWSYYRTTLGMPLPVVLVAIALPAVAFAGLAVLARALAWRGRTLLAILAVPAGWTALEHVVARVSPHGTFGSLAYSQMESLPVVQVASLLGTSGITFLLLLVPSALAVLTVPTAAQERRRLAWTTALAVALALGYGGWRLVQGEPARTPVTVGLVAADRPVQPAAVSSEEGQQLLAGYAREVAGLAARGAEVIVLPETVVRVGADGVGTLREAFAGATEGRTLVLGADRLAAEGESNVAVVFPPDRAEPALYSKQHLLPPFESRYQPGRELTVVDTRWGLLGLAICKDMDFPALGRRYAERGVSMLLVPAWDFTVDGWLHGRMAVLRGVEGGFAVARAARGGRLTISDDRGRVVAEAASAEAELAALLAEIQVGPGGAPYTRLGDSFGWLSCGLLALALVGVGRRRR